MLIDTHTHLYLDEFLPDKNEALIRAIDSGVGKMIFPNVDLLTIEPMRDLHRRFPTETFMAMGLHPTEVKADFPQALKIVEDELILHSDDYVAIGEIGMDLYWDKTFREEQMKAFETQCRWAIERDLPVIIHCREALDETLEVLSGFSCKPRGVFHSFGGSHEDVEKIKKVGDFYFGFNGVVTYKSFPGSSTLQAVGKDRILLETDSPYLSPVPRRGRRNESSNLTYIASKIAELMDIPVQEVEDVSSSNATTLFRIS